MNWNQDTTHRHSQRGAAVRSWLETRPESAAVFDILDNIDEAAIIEAARAELFPLEKIDDWAREEEASAQAAVYEYSYHGADAVGWADGQIHESCLFDGKASNTDLFQLEGGLPGLETDPEIGYAIGAGFGDDYGGIPLDVLAAWHTYSITHPAQDDETHNAHNGYHELFMIKLCSLLQQACDSVYKQGADSDNLPGLIFPFHLFVNSHERWPVHIYTVT